MANYLYYGSYAFPSDLTHFTINRHAIVGPTGRRNYVNHQWIINGSVRGANSAAVMPGGFWPR